MVTNKQKLVMLPKPPNPTVKIEESEEQITITIPEKTLNPVLQVVSVLFSAVFIFAFISFANSFLTSVGDSGRIVNYPGFILAVVVFLLMGVMIFWQAYQTVQPTKPTIFTLTTDHLHYDSGFVPQLSINRYQFSKSKYTHIQTTFTHPEIKTIRLKTDKGENKLTIITNNKRLELANNISDRERGWLYQVLKDHYGF